MKNPEGFKGGTGTPDRGEPAALADEGPPPSSDRRAFLGWSRSLPELAADWFLQRHASSAGDIDASDEVWVFTGARAGREFLRRIHDGLVPGTRPLIPPQVITPGRLAEVVVEEFDSTTSAATTLEVRSAWAAELSAATGAIARALLGSRSPSMDEVWPLADRFAKAVAELRGEGLEPSVMIEHAAPAESERWQAIAEVDRRVGQRLAACGLRDPDVAREAAAARGALRPVRLVAAGVLEWTRWQRQILDRGQATMLVAAPEHCAEDFDEFGAVVPERWIGRASPVAESSVLPVASPEDAMAAMLEAVEHWSHGRSPAAITVGLSDPTLANAAARASRAAGLPLHVAEGDAIAASAPGRLIAALEALLSTPSASGGASFLLHPLGLDWAAGKACVSEESVARMPSALASLRDERMPSSLGDLMAASAMPIDRGRYGSVKLEDREQEREALRKVLTAIGDLVDAWTGHPARGRVWSERLGSWLGEVGASLERRVVADGSDEPLRRQLVEHYRSVGEVLREFAQVPDPLDPELAGQVWLRRILERLAEVRETPLPESGSIEALGWLELAADPAPCLAILGMHDAATPGAAGVDPLLPERIRERLGLGSARRREARDAAILAAVAGRCEHLVVIVPLKDCEGNTLLPSRLLLHDEGGGSADRVLRFTTAGTVLRRDGAAASTGFRVPAPDPTRPLPAKLSVTALRQYLADPRRFELRHVERLEEVCEARGELDPLRFGVLAHTVLERFGGDPELRSEFDATRLRGRLDEILDEIASEAFGHGPRASILVQLRNLRRRLHRFAVAEAASRAQGWETRQVELWLDAALELGSGEGAQPFTGRVDRVDRHRETGRIRVLDYKTGDEVADPMRNHLLGKGDRRRWIDLQLPIYRHLLAKQWGVPESLIDVGYVRLARSSQAQIFRTIDGWDERVFEEAIEKAREVVRAIRAREFPMAEPPPYSDAFSNLLHEPVIAAEVGGEVEP